MNKEVLNVREAAELLNISKTLLYREVKSNETDIPHFKIGNRILFSSKKLLEYIEKA